MPKPRSKRQAIRDERKQKRQDQNGADDHSSAKRRRLNDNDGDHDNDATNNADENVPVIDYDYGASAAAAAAQPEKEFFGMLSEEEQEYFRSVDEQLDIDDFPSHEDRQLYLASVFTEAQGKELKLACSQSCSRLMERLILMSNTRQKKKLFEQFAGHFLNLIQHRFASHCCETLFLQSAPIVTQELSGERDDQPMEGEEADEKPLPYMEELFLLTLDELEGQLGFLLTDRFASHTLRVFLIILSGRPLEQSATKSLIHSKKKEKIATPWVPRESDELETQLRAVPSSFTLATNKIISDVVTGMSPTELRVLATHPTGNPALQLMLELDISVNSKAGTANETTESDGMMLLWQLLPGGPSALKESTSPACEFINSMLYDPIGSRLLETLITNAPGRLFKAMYKNLFKERIHSFLRNDIASYPAIRVLNRLGKEDLVTAVQQTIPDMPKLITLSRFNVIKALFERCHARQAHTEVKALTQALVQAYGGDKKSLVPKLCQLEDVKPSGADDADNGDDGSNKKSKSKKNGDHDPLAKNRAALVSHGSHLATTMLAIPGPPSDAIQTSISALTADQLYHLASSSRPTSHVVTAALKTPSSNKAFHKALVSSLRPRVVDLVLTSENGGDRVVSAIINMPTTSPPARGGGGDSGQNATTTTITATASLPLHLKESIMTSLGDNEKAMRDSYQGRRVWRNAKADLWAHRRAEWVAWQKEIEPIVVLGKAHGGAKGPTGSNGVAVGGGGGGGSPGEGGAGPARQAGGAGRGRPLPPQSSQFAASGNGNGRGFKGGAGRGEKRKRNYDSVLDHSVQKLGISDKMQRMQEITQTHGEIIAKHYFVYLYEVPTILLILRHPIQRCLRALDGAHEISEENIAPFLRSIYGGTHPQHKPRTKADYFPFMQGG
ncbi:armadillo-type protein [Microdochium trichocladiopsis]|uniref:Nucleolar protein 9 n=1 Tax=Microdochium trichocladiopsis TaxID=1682393 RepID=A0A9P8Y2E1_9PEZI|nr:armadillo-type protein [Microdochium trichocladiopsis]KAH7029189.1 armadillo-type protein [Microdochium trichocladiopsis]